jgi:hypothetical protein
MHQQANQQTKTQIRKTLTIMTLALRIAEISITFQRATTTSS